MMQQATYQDLSALFVGNHELEQLEQSLDVFCPFEAIGMVDQEIRHAHFLKYIFDPTRPHGFGTTCLRAFLAVVANSGHESVQDIDAIDIHIMNFDNALVRREWRNIDLLIDVPDENLIIAIELKIDSKEHGRQLENYRRTIASEWPDRKKLLVFLTKRGDLPQVDGPSWVPIQLAELVGALSLVETKSLGSAEARQLLSNYISMIGRHHLSDERLEKLAASLWSKHRAALEFLSERRPEGPEAYIFSELLGRIADIADKMTAESGHRVIADHSTPGHLRFAIECLDTTFGFKSARGWTPSCRTLLIEIAKNGRSVRPIFVLGPGDEPVRQQIFDKLKAAGADIGKQDKGKKQALSPSWSRFASHTAFNLKKDADVDIEKAVVKILEEVGIFAKMHIPAYVSALVD